MLPHELGSKVRKIIDAFRDKSIINNTYFNPAFADRLGNKVEELRELGFNLAKTETESNEGTVISGLLITPSGERLELGSILLDGKSIVVKKAMVTVDDLVNFITESVPKEF